MDFLAMSPATLVAVIVAFSFAAGLNVYATVFSLGVMARMHWLLLPSGLDSLTHTWILMASGILFAGEFVADKIPGVDLVWNALHTFVRIPVAALLAYGAGSHLSPEMHVLVTGLGAGFAAIAHGSKTAMRVAVTPSPEPLSNIALSTGEDGLAVGLSWAAMHHPLTAGVVVLLLSAGGVAGVWWGLRSVRAGWARLKGRQPRLAGVRPVET